MVTLNFPSPLTGEGGVRVNKCLPLPFIPSRQGRGDSIVEEKLAMKQLIRFTLNGDPVEVEIDPHLTLLQLLRDKLEFLGTKEGCGMGECGACTVLLDGKTINSCIFPAVEVEGRSITTIEGLADAKGMGEMANAHTAPAIANAVYNACGVRIRDLPLKPAKILKELRAKRG